MSSVEFTPSTPRLRSAYRLKPTVRRLVLFPRGNHRKALLHREHFLLTVSLPLFAAITVASVSCSIFDAVVGSSLFDLLNGIQSFDDQCRKGYYRIAARF